MIGHERPTSSRKLHPFIQNVFPEVRRDKLSTDGSTLSPKNFVHAALARTSPLAKADAEASKYLPPDLVAAIDAVAMAGDDIVRARATRMTEIRTIAARLAPLRMALDELKCDGARQIAAPLNVALLAALTDALDWPDVLQPLNYVRGFPAVFDVADSGVFRSLHEPAEMTCADFQRGNTRMVTHISDNIRRSMLRDNNDDAERRAQCWKKTKEEIRLGLVRPPRSRAQVDRKFGRGKWRCLGRNAIIQKKKWRCIDDGRRSKHNAATGTHERIVCGRADFPLLVAREFGKRFLLNRNKLRRVGKLRMQHGTDDASAAYRHIPTAQPEYTVVAVWDDDNKDVVYCEVPGFNFGLKSAVLNYNRFPEISIAVARRLLWVCTEHYFDDNDVCEPDYAKGTGQQCFVELVSNSLIGYQCDKKKHVAMDVVNEYLGVVSDLSSFATGTLVVDVSEGRRASLLELVTKHLRERKLSKGPSSTIFGKSRFMLSPTYGAMGRACLQPIKARQYSELVDLTPELFDSLEFIAYACVQLPPLRVPLLPPQNAKVVVFVDAEGKRRPRGGNNAYLPKGHVGFVVHHPTLGIAHGSGIIPDSTTRLFDSIKKRETYIGQYELLGAIVPFISLPPKWFSGYQVELYIDNSGAIGGLIKGYSGVPDCARIINTFHFAIAKLGLASIWIDYVPTESNPADDPSRFHEMSRAAIDKALESLGVAYEAKLPELASQDGQWLSFSEIASSVWA